MMTDLSAEGRVEPGRSDGRIKVWDPLVRIFHWSLVALFTFSFFTGDEWKSAHVWSGYAIGTLLAIRIVWGLIGTRHARFASFLYSPATILVFIKDSLTFKAKRYVGHNPAGGVMVLLLILMISGIVTTGYMMTTDAYWGIEWVEETHETLVYATLGLIVLHVAGVVFASLEHRENLARAMVTGWKRAE